MKLPIAPGQYSQANEQQARGAVERADMQNHKRNSDVEIGQGRLILTSPDGTRWSVTVDNAGAISAASV